MSDEQKKGHQKNLGYVFKKLMGGLKNFMGIKKFYGLKNFLGGNKLLWA